jgi:hypothetical protein
MNTPLASLLIFKLQVTWYAVGTKSAPNRNLPFGGLVTGGYVVESAGGRDEYDGNSCDADECDSFAFDGRTKGSLDMGGTGRGGAGRGGLGCVQFAFVGCFGECDVLS